MTKISENSLRSGVFCPNVYVKSISIGEGGSIDSNSGATADTSSTFSQRRRLDGSINYFSSTTPGTPGDGSTKITLDVQVKDIIDSASGNGIWEADSAARASAVLCVLQSSNPALTNELISGSFFDRGSFRAPSGYARLIDYEIKEVSLAPREGQQTDFSRHVNSETQNTILSFNRRVEFSLPQESPQHLTYFALVKLNHVTTRVPRSTTHSMVTVERLFDGGALISNSYVFRDPQNLIWAGPVHQHPGTGWMEGAYHVSASHSSLRRIPINNFKIKDTKVFSQIENFVINLGTPPRTRADVSDAYISRDVQNNATLMFTFDHLNYMIQNSKYGTLYANSSTRIQNELLRNSKITNLSVMRKRVVETVGVNQIGSTAEVLYEFADELPPEVLVVSSDEGGVLSGISRYVVDGEDYNKFKDVPDIDPPPTDSKFYGSIQEISVSKIGRKRAFMVKDGSVSRIADGKYQYGLRLEVDDAAFSYLSSKLTQLGSMIELMSSYFAMASNPQNYDPKTGRFTAQFVRQQVTSPGRTPAWLASIIMLVETLDLLTEITTSQKATVANSLYTLINPSCGTITSLQQYINTLQIFQNRFEKAIGKSKSTHTRDKSSISQANARTRLNVELSFPQTFDASVAHGTGFQYIDLQGADMINPQNLRTRVDDELDRYRQDLFHVQELQSDFDFISRDDAEALVSDTTRYSYVAPSSFRLNNVIVDLLSANKDDIDFSSITAAIRGVLESSSNRVLDVQDNREVAGLLRQAGSGPTTERIDKLSRAFSSVASESGIYVNNSLNSIVRPSEQSQSRQRPRSSEEYLGSSNKFTTGTDSVQPTTLREPRVAIAASLSILQDIFGFRNQPRDESEPQTDSLDRISFDLSRSDNFINKRIRPAAQANARAVTSALDALPTQIKLLTRNRGRVYKDQFASLSTDIDAGTDAFVYNFSMIRVIEYLSGYEASDARRPIWRRLDTSIMNSATNPLLCRVRRYVDAGTNIGAFEELASFPVYNEFFLVSAGATRRQRPVIRSSFRQISASNLIDGFETTSFTRGPEGTIARKLITLGRQFEEIEGEVEYISSSITGAPTGPRGRMTGVVTSSTASPPTPAPERPRVSAAPAPRRDTTAPEPRRGSPARSRSTSGAGY